MIVKILFSINQFLLTKLGLTIITLLTIFCFSYLYDYNQKLRTIKYDDKITYKYGILDLEFANKEESSEIIKSWRKSSDFNTEFFYKTITFDRIKLAKYIIYGDYLFIFLYSILLFLLMNYTYKNYDLSFISIRFNTWFNSKREHMIFILVFIIALSDIIENLIIYQTLNKKLLSDEFQNFKILLVKTKFMLFAISTIIIVFVNTNKLIYSLIIDPKLFSNKILKYFRLNNL